MSIVFQILACTAGVFNAEMFAGAIAPSELFAHWRGPSDIEVPYAAPRAALRFDLPLLLEVISVCTTHIYFSLKYLNICNLLHILAGDLIFEYFISHFIVRCAT